MYTVNNMNAEITPILQNNPVQPGNVLWDRGVYEQFKLINFDNVKPIYYISTYGRLFSMSSGKQMNYILENQGYVRVILRLNNDTTKSYKIHRLVAMSFIPRTVEEIQIGRDYVNHKNLIKTDNFIGNLEWSTPKENTNHAHVNGAYNLTCPIQRESIDCNRWGGTNVIGQQVGMSRLTDDQAHIICQCLENNLSYEQCCYSAGLECNKANRTIICNIKAGRRWQHISSQYNIPKDMQKQNTLSEYVVPVCELLAKQTMTIKAIVEELQLPGSYDAARMFVSAIKNRKSYVDISVNYKW